MIDAPVRRHRPDQLEIIAHRGTPREHPENSLPGFRRAIELGAHGIELDVHLTADGVLVVHHDPVVRRTAPESPEPDRAIRDINYRALRDYPLSPGVPIPTLGDVLDLVADRAVVYIEVKAAGAERHVVHAIQEYRGRCAIHGFDHRVSLRSAALAPGVPTGILLASYLLDPAGALRGAQARDYWQVWDLIDGALVERVHDEGGRVVAWTVNDPDEASRLRALGVDAICTDVCGIMRRALGDAVGGTRGSA